MMSKKKHKKNKEVNIMNENEEVLTNEELLVNEEEPVQLNLELDDNQIAEESSIEKIEEVTNSVEENPEPPIEEINEIIDESNDTVNETTDETYDEVNKIIGHVNAKQLNVRKEPSSNSDVLFIVNENTEVIIDEDLDNEFVKVIINGTVGYCMKRFITIES